MVAFINGNRSQSLLTPPEPACSAYSKPLASQEETRLRKHRLHLVSFCEMSVTQRMKPKTTYWRRMWFFGEDRGQAAVLQTVLAGLGDRHMGPGILKGFLLAYLRSGLLVRVYTHPGLRRHVIRPQSDLKEETASSHHQIPISHPLSIST